MNDRLYTLSEAAEILRLTNRGVAKIARRHGLCLVRGRDILLTPKDIEDIKDTLRVQPTDPLRWRAPPPLSDYRLRKSLQQLARKEGRAGRRASGQK